MGHLDSAGVAGHDRDVGYSGNKGTDLQTITYANVADPMTGRIPIRLSVRSIPDQRQQQHVSRSHLSARRTLVQVVMSANYMWSHAINDGSLGGGEADIVSPENPFCRSCEKASSTQDIRHFVTFNSVYSLPFGAGRTWLSQPGLLARFLADGRWLRF